MVSPIWATRTAFSGIPAVSTAPGAENWLNWFRWPRMDSAAFMVNVAEWESNEVSIHSMRNSRLMVSLVVPSMVNTEPSL